MITGMSALIPKQEENQSMKRRLAGKMMDRLAQAIDDTDEAAAQERVTKLQANHPDAPIEELADKLIAQKCRDTAVVGATTSGTMLIPGLGTLAGLTLGVAADIGITFKMQAELVLEMATLYGHQLTPEEKRRTVLLVTGLSAGTTAVAHRAGKRISQRATARIGSKYIVKAIPVIGIAAAAATNVVTTYIVGKRAQAYFSLGPEALLDWSTGAAAITGINREALLSGAKKGGHVMKRVGGTAVNGTKKTRSALTRLRPRRKKQSPPIKDEIIPVFDMPAANS